MELLTSQPSSINSYLPTFEKNVMVIRKKVLFLYTFLLAIHFPNPAFSFNTLFTCQFHLWYIKSDLWIHTLPWEKSWGIQGRYINWKTIIKNNISWKNHSNHLSCRWLSSGSWHYPKSAWHRHLLLLLRDQKAQAATKLRVAAHPLTGVWWYHWPWWPVLARGNYLGRRKGRWFNRSTHIIHNTRITT